MFGRSISLASLFLVLLFLTPHVLADSEEQFQDLVRDVPEEILHAALHDFGGPKFQHGVFPGDRPALDVIHRERAADATRLVKLAKRQRNNTTTTNPSTGPTSTPATTTPIITSSGQSSASGTPTTTTTGSSGSSITAASSSKRATSSTSIVTRTSTGPNGVSTYTELTIVVPEPTEEPTTPTGTASESPTGTAGLSGGLRVSAGNGGIVAFVAALGFFML